MKERVGDEKLIIIISVAVTGINDHITPPPPPVPPRHLGHDRSLTSLQAVAPQGVEGESFPPMGGRPKIM